MISSFGSVLKPKSTLTQLWIRSLKLSISIIMPATEKCVIVFYACTLFGIYVSYGNCLVYLHGSVHIKELQFLCFVYDHVTLRSYSKEIVFRISALYVTGIVSGTICIKITFRSHPFHWLCDILSSQLFIGALQ